MKLSDFDFELPDDLIATRPASPRSSARLLVADEQSISDQHVTDLTQYLEPGDRLVLNDTKVIPARLTGLRRRFGPEGQTEARIDVTLLEPLPGGQWKALIKPLKKVRDGEEILFGEDLAARVLGREDGTALLEFNKVSGEFDAALNKSGAMPLPPYIAAKRPADSRDKTDYQTVFARHSGAVAAPTASLHFDAELLSRIVAQGIDITFVTLHVGAGTFLPVKVDDVRDHKMHSERGEVTPVAANEINATIKSGGRIIPVGTTALRLIETAADEIGHINPWSGSTDIFISPGYRFRITDALMTNFHLPRSTLLMLVSALMGTARVREIYAHAIKNRYRFFSYGDGSFLVAKGKTRR